MGGFDYLHATGPALPGRPGPSRRALRCRRDMVPRERRDRRQPRRDPQVSSATATRSSSPAHTAWSTPASRALRWSHPGTSPGAEPFELDGLFGIDPDDVARSSPPTGRSVRSMSRTRATTFSRIDIAAGRDRGDCRPACRSSSTRPTDRTGRSTAASRPTALAAAADLVVQSPHKTLGSLTQSSLLHASGGSRRPRAGRALPRDAPVLVAVRAAARLARRRGRRDGAHRPGAVGAGHRPRQRPPRLPRRHRGARGLRRRDHPPARDRRVRPDQAGRRRRRYRHHGLCGGGLAARERSHQPGVLRPPAARVLGHLRRHRLVGRFLGLRLLGQARSGRSPPASRWSRGGRAPSSEGRRLSRPARFPGRRAVRSPTAPSARSPQRWSASRTRWHPAPRPRDRTT